MSDLVYWRSPIKSAIVMVAGLTVLLSLGCLSMISVFAYLCLAILCCTGAWRIYFDLVKSKKEGSPSAPFGECLSKEFVVPRERVSECVNKSLDQSSDCINYLKHALLIENYLDSLKFALYMYLLSIVGGFFNLITIVLICFVALFSLPKVYELYHTQIDHNYGLVRKHVVNVWSKVEAQMEKIPLLRKQKAN